MRKFKLLTVVSALVLCLGLMITPVKAAEYVEIAEYKEVFKPAADGAANLTATVKGTADNSGYLYLIKTLKDTTVVSVEGDAVVGELEEVKTGTVSFYRVKVNTTEETTVTAKFTVAGFYPTTTTNEDNGGSNYSLAYTFTNHLQSQIGKYVVTVHVPEGHETVKVTTPAKYDKQKLGLTDDGIRTVGASGKVAASATSGVAFTYNTPLSGTMNMAIWGIAVVVGGLIFVDRLRKAKAE